MFFGTMDMRKKFTCVKALMSTLDSGQTIWKLLSVLLPQAKHHRYSMLSSFIVLSYFDCRLQNDGDVPA